MDADDFYNEFKHALKAVGDRWPGTETKVQIRGDAIVFSRRDYLYALRLPKPKKRKYKSK